MPTRETAPIGAPCWVDLISSDTSRVREFYTSMFGWEAEEPNEDFGGYFNFTKNGVRIAGCMQAQPDEPTGNVWTIYLATSDAAKTVELAGASGGPVLVPATPVADLGSMGVVSDPDNAVIGLWQPGAHKGFGIVGEPGTPSWFELYTRKYEDAVAFYREVFGWETEVVSDTDQFRYTVQKHGDDWLAGIADATAMLPEGVPAHWAVYFGVEDTDAALEKVTSLGGHVVTPAEDTPYGRLATVADPNGAAFKLVGPNEAMPMRDGQS